MLLLWLILALILTFISFVVLGAISDFFNRETEAQKKQREDAENRWQNADNRWQKDVADKKIRKERHRDADFQETPYTYSILTHGNEALAIRYGIANQERKVKEYLYYAKGGEQIRNPDRDRVYYEPATTISLRKTKKISKDVYEVLLSDYRDRKATAVIEVGKEYVKTFLPLEQSWFEKHADLEKTLKGNGSFTLKELATFHVQKAVR